MSNESESTTTTLSPQDAMIKPGADLREITARMAFAFTVAFAIYRDFGFPCVVTSGGDGTHMRESKHYAGDAIDLRSPSYYTHGDGDPVLGRKVGRALREALGPQFDVVVEGYEPRPNGQVPPRHIHVEFDPKENVG
mgnify:FL=1